MIHEYMSFVDMYKLGDFYQKMKEQQVSVQYIWKLQHPSIQPVKLSAW